MAKKLQLLRNQTVFGTKASALTGLSAQLAKMSAGEPAIASYTDGVKKSILLGIALDDSNYQIFEGAKIGEDGNLEIPQEVQAAIDTLKNTVTTNKVVAGLGIDVNVGKNTTVSAKIKSGKNALNVDKEGLFVDNSVLDKYVGSNAIAVSEAQEGVKTISLTIDATDKVLTQAVSGLKTSLSLNYVSDTKKLQLLGNTVDSSNVISEIDAAAFVKDGILKNVELVVLNKGTTTNPGNLADGTYLKFTFNTDAGAEEIYVNVTSLIDVYTAGNGIEVSGKFISVKRDTTSESFLTVGVDGVKLSGVQTAINQAKDAAISTIKGDVETLNTLGKIEDKITAIDAYTINTKAIKNNPVLNGADVKLDGYAKPTGTNAELTIASTDTVNTAFGKVENKISTLDGNVLKQVEAGSGITVTSKAANKQTISANVKSGDPIIEVTVEGIKTKDAAVWDCGTYGN